MRPTSAVARLRHYYRRHGLRAMMQRIKLAFQRASSLGQMIVYACDLPVTGGPAPLGTVTRKSTYAALNAAESKRIVEHWNPDAMPKLMAEQFAAKAELWLLLQDGIIAAYGWTLKGKTIEPHYFPFKAEDVHLFDFFVFPEFRGRNLNPSLVWQILDQAGREGCRRAFIEAAVWNRPQQASLAKTSFQKIGTARKFSLGKSNLVWWGPAEP
jgi:GNAT superfamily N-acetyltransferase